MKTKNIFKALALAILMPATMLTTACSSDDDAIVNNEIINQKGFTIPVTINVTREGDEGTTRVTYNESTKKLEFSDGDKLFVSGTHATAGNLAGVLTWVSEGTFSGTIITQHEYTGTTDALLTAANAELLPAGYEIPGYLSIPNTITCNSSVTHIADKAFATAKAAAVEQFSRETAWYSSGFALSPENAILSFTITGLTPSTEVTAILKTGSGIYTTLVSGNVTTNGSGEATFAMALDGGAYNIKDLTLTVGGNDITFTDKNNVLAAGKIYNITRAVPAAVKALSAVTSSELGWRIGSDGNAYEATGSLPTGVTAVAIIAYVGSAGSVDASSASYKGLAIALSDANSGNKCQWAKEYSGYVSCLSSCQAADITTALGYKNGISCTSTLTSDGHSSHNHTAATAAASNNGTDAPTGTSGWFLPSMGQWNLIVQGLASKKAGAAVTTDLTFNTNNATYKAGNLNSVITAAGGTGFQETSYWSSTEENASYVWYMYFKDGCASHSTKDGKNVRSALAF
jgi:hypothetical protein